MFLVKKKSKKPTNKRFTFYSFRGFSFLALGADVALGRGRGPPFVVPRLSPWPKILGSPRLFLPPNCRGVTPSGNMEGFISSARSSLRHGALFQIHSHFFKCSLSPTPQCHNTCSKSLQHGQCNSGKLRATHAMHITHATNKNNKNKEFTLS